MKLLFRLFVPLYIFTIIGFFFFSYTQVDLSLTLSRMSLWQVIEKSFQYIGYFERPVATDLYFVLLALLFISYIFMLLAVSRKKFSREAVWGLIFFTAILLTFAYNAFSYDLFNYIFDAKIITYYHLNPYQHMALDFPHDPMLSFMHWTQRTYPYGPSWLLVTVPLSFIGFQFFLPTLFLFKALASFAYLGTCYFLEKILQKREKEHALFGLSVFAFSPLVIIEGLLSAHNDITMVFFATAGLFFLVKRKGVWSFILLLLSIGIKFATAMLLPLWIVYFFIKKRDNYWQLFVGISLLFMIIPVIFASARTNFQPWYLLFLFPLVALLPRRKEIIVGYTTFSLTALLQYVPFFYTGAWNPPIPFILVMMTWIGLIVSICIMFFVIMRQGIVVKH